MDDLCHSVSFDPVRLTFRKDDDDFMFQQLIVIAHNSVIALDRSFHATKMSLLFRKGETVEQLLQCDRLIQMYAQPVSFYVICHTQIIIYVFPSETILNCIN